ncbi:MAG: tRNA pseudouridine(38-40) synthase TruA [Candidatus Metalachnospira sp.]|nr:tRNA pseudouridine(38-40) synthase TruA [Candidatus Metalachnospira sp.]
MIKNIAVILQYDGTRYSGWQKQGNTDNTIQSKLENILFRLCSIETEVHGSGRTDAGVHAFGQTANFKIDTDKSPEEIMGYINTYLPTDIAVISAWQASDRFHSRLNAVKKTYRYTILTGNAPDVFSEKYIWPHKDKLNIDEMRKGALQLIGTHDFKSFTDNKKNKKSTVRNIEKIEIAENGNKITIDMTGDGFLYHMARIIVGTLVEVGENKTSAEDISKIVNSLSREETGPLAPAKGLMLMKVYYN